MLLQNYTNNKEKMKECMKKTKNERNKKNSFSISILTSKRASFLM